METKNTSISLSVVDVEQKYAYNPTETINSGGIVSWGKDNDLPQLLSNCYDKSATLKAAIDQSINYVMGDGIDISEGAAKWKDTVNRRKDTLEDIVSHLVIDYYTFGNFAFQVIFNGLGIPVELYALNVAKCRLNENGTKVYYSKKLWTKYQTKSEEYDRFGYADFNPDKPTQIYFYNGTGVRSVYNKAPWSAALDDVLTEIEGSHYSLNSVVSGFSARYVLNLPDTANLTDEQKQIIEDGIRSRFCGPDASNFMLYYSNDESKNLTVQKIEANEDPDHFIAIRNGAKDNIFTSLRISPLLCGLSTGTNTGFSTQEFSDSYKLFDRTVAEPVRRTLEKAINEAIMVKNGMRIKPFVLTFENND